MVPLTNEIAADNSIGILNSVNVQVVVSKKTYDLYKSGKINKDLERLTRPLEKGRIESAEFEAKSSDGNSLSHRITAEDRPFFEIDDLEIAHTQEIQLEAKLNSLTKSTNSGYLHLPGEKRVFYRYLGNNPSNLHSIFGNYDGTVTIQCKAHMDAKLDVVSLDIFQIERLQKDLFD